MSRCVGQYGSSCWLSFFQVSSKKQCSVTRIDVVKLNVIILVCLEAAGTAKPKKSIKRKRPGGGKVVIDQGGSGSGDDNDDDYPNEDPDDDDDLDEDPYSENDPCCCFCKII